MWTGGTAIVTSDADLCVVVDDDGVVQGVLRRDVAGRAPQETAGQAMTPGVSTVRPSENVAALAERMRRRRVETVLVTRSDGKLLGRLNRGHAQAALDRFRG